MIEIVFSFIGALGAFVTIYEHIRRIHKERE